MPTQLPVEIIGRIIQLIYHSSSKRKAILPLLLVSPTFRIETERLLYSHLCLTTVAQVVRCFHTINSRPNIPRTVRQLHISLDLNSTAPQISLFDFLNVDGTILTDAQVQRLRDARAAKHTGKVLRAFGDLVTQTLNKLVSLQEYSLSLGGRQGRDEPVFAPMWLPAQPPFKLRRFIVDLNLSSAMTRFLQSQSSITDLLAPHLSNQGGHLPLPPGSLPKLRGLVMSPEAASLIVPGRPVKRVVLKPSKSATTRHLDSILNAIPFLAQSSIPVKSIDLVLPQLSTAPETLLRPLAAGLPHLEHIILRRGFILANETLYDAYESDAFSSALAEFQHLKTFQIPAPSAYHHAKEAGIMNQMQDPFGGALTIQANINGQIFTNQPPLQPPPPPPVVFGPPLPPDFPNPNGNQNGNGNPGGVLGAGAGAGAGGGLQGMGGGFFAIPLGGGFLGGGMIPGLPPLPAGQAVGNAGNPPPPPAAGPGAGGLPGIFQNLFGFDQPPPNPNPNGNGNDVGPLPPPPAPGQAPGPILENFDDLPVLMDDPGDGEVVADFFVVTAGPMEGDPGGNANEPDANPDGQHAQPQQGDANPHLPQPDGANAAPPLPPLPPFNLNQVLNQATNLIMQQLQNHLFGGIVAGGPGGAAAGGAANPNPAPAANANPNTAPTAGANPPPNLTTAATPAESDNLPPLEPLAVPEPPEPADNGGVAAALPPPPAPPAGPAPPLNFQTTFLTAWNPMTGELVMDAGPDTHGAPRPSSTRRRDWNDPEVVEILDKGQRALKTRELKVLDKWKLGGYASKLKTVIFDMDPPVRRRTIWTWKESASSTPQPTSSRLTTVSDGDEDGDVEIRNVDEDADEANSSLAGKWEVEYVNKGTLNINS